jgi:hypothetical protein
MDFDNTIVCYDQVFHQVAIKKGLIPIEVPVNKGSVRDYLRERGRESAWIELQGYVYGACMWDVLPFPDVLEFFTRCKRQGVEVCIISHKTRYPFQGPRYDLHQAAYAWLENYGFYDPSRIGLLPDQVYFEQTKQGKLDRIAQRGCSHFIDDLPEFLAEPGFPADIQRILFDPQQMFHPNDPNPINHRFQLVTSWKEIEKTLL